MLLISHDVFFDEFKRNSVSPKNNVTESIYDLDMDLVEKLCGILAINYAILENESK